MLKALLSGISVQFGPDAVLVKAQDFGTLADFAAIVHGVAKKESNARVAAGKAGSNSTKRIRPRDHPASVTKGERRPLTPFGHPLPASRGEGEEAPPLSGIRNPKSKIQNPKSKIRGPLTRPSGPLSPHRGARGKDAASHSAFQNPKSKIQNARGKERNAIGAASLSRNASRRSRVDASRSWPAARTCRATGRPGRLRFTPRMLNPLERRYRVAHEAERISTQHAGPHGPGHDLTLACSIGAPAFGADPWVVYEGSDGPGKGKHVVLISGDEEYRSEEALPQLGKILAKHHGFKCTVLFAIDQGRHDQPQPERQHPRPGSAASGRSDDHLHPLPQPAR